MNIILVLIPVTLLVVGVGAALFFWAVNHQQFDDLDSPGIVPLLEDDPDQNGGPGQQASSEPSPTDSDSGVST
ncbi:cbb3-type cytochrome oxidase assembly protein CcoS [Dyella sp. KRB-257]|uniref:cbb3-type cytochrome oxidase assembly protein CcoS n=1 Tax=Dyella sp. KRB-257 TaxID=3400915 RepID=UPI003C088733